MVFGGMKSTSERLNALNQEYANGQSKLKEIEENYTRNSQRSSMKVRWKSRK